MSYRDSSRDGKGKAPSKYLDLENVDTRALTIEHKKSQNEALLWIIDEFNILFDDIAQEFKKTEITSYREYAKELIPFFKKYSDSDNTTLASLSQRGLSLVYDRFPELDIQ